MGRSTPAFSFSLLASLALGFVLVVQTQQNPGFISIDCGATNAYIEKENNIAYQTDEGFIDSGKNMQISTEVIYRTSLQLSKNLRSFPNGTRNCYTLRPDRGKNNTYLIRASFWYGNYDGKNQTPSFDLYIDTNYWSTVGSSIFFNEEMMYVSQADDIQVCLVNTGNGVPFISALELRTLGDDIYRLGSGFLQLHWRYDIGQSSKTYIRYPIDVYDRIWTAKNYNLWFILNTTYAIDLSEDNDAYKYKVPGDVVRTAQRSMKASSPMYLQWTPSISTNRWIVYFYFVEIERLADGLQREFTISINDNQIKTTVSLEYLKPVIVVSTAVTGSLISFSIESTNNSGHPPILNAMEYYTFSDLSNVPTAQDDVKAINGIKVMYYIERESWQGDPCVPSYYKWDSLNYSYGNPPRIISLNLSSSGLKGLIATSISNLTAVVSLDLSNNSLTGSVPDFLAQMPSLRVLNLSGNNLNGSLPQTLLKKKPKKKGISVAPIIASVAAVLVLISLGAPAVLWIIKRRQIQNGAAVTTTTTFGGSTGTLELSKNRHFTSTEVARITDNFRTIIGEGGFGKVYFGRLHNGSQVAVKMLSQSSKQGYKEFYREAQLLMVVHHRNLVSLIGYCEEFENTALIYEFMSNGNVRQHLSARNPNVLTWSQRLQIAINAAQGLEYLHNGCKPPIIHRDLKTPNILLNENMQAKICDFGLSKAFVTEQDSYISTCPEFHILGHSSQKSDIYSFGIVLFELITGHPAIIRSPEGSMHILHWVTPFIERGDIQSIVDPRLNDQFNISSVQKAMEIAMACVPMNADERADMNCVLSELKECLTVEIISGRSQRMGNSERRSEFDTTTMELDSHPYAR
ncbi:hypothetical protein ACJRO7_005677 [Eucalyptus globulus]|uniref:non-specific serine/threonine protein kinase n=1 Tax=Eucalyptus globulus TaxID=34317 RepID=A0ABD3J687_EUCGL